MRLHAAVAVLLSLLEPAVAQLRPGLLGEFTDGRRTVSFAAPTPNFYLEPDESVHPSLGPLFRGEWVGFLQVLANAEYEFNRSITIDGVSGTRHRLATGRHRVRVPFARRPGVAQLRLEWRSADFDWEPVPRSALFWEGDVPAAEQGRWLVFEARCANCHPGSGLSLPAPSLAALSTGASRTWLYAKLLRHPGLRLTAQQSADISARLGSRSTAPEVRPRAPGEVAVGKGGELFGTMGCVHCHAPESFAGLGSKYSMQVLEERLARHRPDMLLDQQEAASLAAYLTRDREPELEAPAPNGDPQRGSALLTALGCISCHESRQDAKPLAQLFSAACPKISVPWSDEEQVAVRSFLRTLPDRARAPVYAFPYQLRRHQCVACHRQGTGAPSLEGAGDKLKTSWIGQLLWGSRRMRPHLELRMPRYAQEDVSPWLGSFAKAEGLAPGEGAPSPPFTDARRQEGIGLLGTNPKKGGMGCIGCHDWGEHASLGEEGPQLIDAAARLRLEWFERWMRNPARILSGTSMPNYFSSTPAERARQTIHTLWAALEGGRQSGVPDGFRAQGSDADPEARPVPTSSAIVVRWDMPEATPAAIAVGLPGKLSYCFDAGQSRLLYAWRGGFLDLSGTLLRKTDANRLTPTAAIVGEVFWKSAQFPFRFGPEQRIPQARFKGYRLADGVPEFHYQLDGVDVYESLIPMAEENAIRRRIKIQRVAGLVFFEGRQAPQGDNVILETVIK